LLTIEKSVPEQAEAIAKICESGWLETTEGGLCSEWHQDVVIEENYRAPRIKEAMEKGKFGLVAVEDGEVIGVISGGKAKSGVAELYELYVRTDKQFTGAATRLLEAWTETCKTMGITEQRASAQRGNDKWGRFFESKGFRRKGEMQVRHELTGERLIHLRYRRTIV
jgi:N-acetylglutamate synthase-like GNAT family acetyltransferase